VVTMRMTQRGVVSEMENVSFEQVLEAVKALPMMDKRRLRHWLLFFRRLSLCYLVLFVP
jgi:hypothetical protein